MSKLIILSIFLFISCKKEFQTEEVIEIGFIASQIDKPLDTLKSNILNKVKFKYSNLEFEKYPEERNLSVYYVIQDSFYKPIDDIKDLEKHRYGVFSNVEQIDTILIDTFNEKGYKVITFVVYDEVLVPFDKDSVRMRSIISNYGYDIFIK